MSQYPTDPRDPRPQAYGAGAAPRAVGGGDRTAMILAHLSAPAAFLLSAGWLSFLGPLIIWLIYKDRSGHVRVASAGAFNFNITVTLISWAIWLSVFLTIFIGFIWAIPLWIILFIVQVWAHVRGVIRAMDGKTYRYPLQIPILR